MNAIPVVIGIALTLAGVGLGAQNTLSAAKELYVSAAYEEALSALSNLSETETAPDVTRQIDEYRAFCLYALGRTNEAQSIAESLIRKNPMLRLDSGDASPRIQQMFTDVRKRLLPTLIREQFKAARADVDQKRYRDAETPLTEARLMIVEAEKIGVKDEGLSDLGVLVDGFLQLVRTASEQEAAPARAAVAAQQAAATAPAPVVQEEPRTARSAPQPVPITPPPAQPPAAEQTARAAPALPIGQRVYSLADQDVAPPVAVDQRIPPMPMDMTLMVKALHTTGVLDVLIDESGDVLDATIRRSVNVGFDNVVLRAARRWKYKPAVKNGVPVRYIKTIALVP